MPKLEKLEKSRGVVIFANNTDEINFVEIAKANAKLIKRYTGLPTTIVSNDAAPNQRFSTDTNQFIEWKNKGRFGVYECSPYDETILLDADYLILEDSLNAVFSTNFDYRLINKNIYITDPKVVETMGPRGLPFVWATAVFFRKTEKTQQFFQLVSRIQTNYRYYAALYNIQQNNYRNDYAFAIAHYILSGNTENMSQYIPWPLITVNGPITHLELSGSQLIVKAADRAWILPQCNLHVMSKMYLQSDNFRDFVNNAT